jgi:hypothetical protein
MGLIQEVQALSDNNKQLYNEYKRAQKEAEQATKKAEQLAKKLEQAREEKQQKREYERDITKTVERDCIQCMKRCFDREGYQKAFYHLQLVETRKEILQHIPESEVESEYLDYNYERILNKVKKQYENDQKAKNYFLTEQLKEAQKQKEKEEAKQQKKQETKNIFFNLIVFLAYAFIFGFIPFLFFYGYFTIVK